MKFPFWKERLGNRTRFNTLHEAVEAGEYSAVQQFLAQGAHSDGQDGRGATGLHIAAARGYLDLVELLVENGADVDFLIEDGGTPLMAACSCLQPRIVEFLLSKGAQPNRKCDGGRFALVCPFQPAVADVDRQVECIRRLAASGARLDDRTDSGHTPLMTAACFGNAEAAEELLRLGADATLRNNSGKTAAMLAFERGHDGLAQLLKRHAG